MNNTELQEFNSLTTEQKEEYKHQSRKHPGWNHKQLMTKVAFTLETDRIVEEQGDVDPNDKDVMEELIRGVGDWFSSYFPRLWQGLKDFFANILDNIINGVISVFGELLDAIF